MAKVTVEIDEDSVSRVSGNPEQVIQVLRQLGISQKSEEGNTPVDLASYEGKFDTNYSSNARDTVHFSNVVDAQTYENLISGNVTSLSSSVADVFRDEVNITIDKEYPARDIIVDGNTHSVSKHSGRWLDNAYSYYLQTFSGENTITLLENFHLDQPKKNLVPFSNKTLVVRLKAEISGHCVDAINIKSNNTDLHFDTGFIQGRSHQSRYPKKHPDAIQLVPKKDTQFVGGILSNVSILGEAESPYLINEKYHIDTSLDAKQQGILGSDGRFINLNFGDLKIKTQHAIGIHLNGMLSGSFDKIDLSGGATIELYPIRIGGGCNIYIESLEDGINPYEDIYINEVKKDGSPYTILNLRNISLKKVKKDFISRKKPERIYKNFPLDKFYEEILKPENANTLACLKSLKNPMKKAKFIQFCDDFSTENGATISHQ